MPTEAKITENMTKHLTEEERAARAEAERETLPDRARTELVLPAFLKGDKAAVGYWKATLSRLEGVLLLDDLDTEALGVLCAQLSRRDSLGGLLRKLLSDADKEKDLELRLEAVSRVDALNAKLVTLEKAILQAQTALGLTPSGRVRLMRRRAEAKVQEKLDGLFGD